MDHIEQGNAKWVIWAIAVENGLSLHFKSNLVRRNKTYFNFPLGVEQDL